METIYFDNKKAFGYIIFSEDTLFEYSFETTEDLSDELMFRFFNFISRRELKTTSAKNIWTL